jgi:hypothetical protein
MAEYTKTDNITNPELLEIDRELEELLKKQSAKIKVIGCGGGPDPRHPFRQNGVKTRYGVPSDFVIVQGSYNKDALNDWASNPRFFKLSLIF